MFLRLAPTAFHHKPLVRLLYVFWLLAVAFAPSPGYVQAQDEPDALWQTYRDGLPSSNVSAIMAAGDGALWFGTDGGAARFDGSWQSEPRLPAGRVRAIAQTNDGALWFGLETGGLVRRTPGGDCCTTWTVVQGLPSDDVRALLPNDESVGDLWVGTSAGLVYVESERVTPVPGAPKDAVWAIARGEDGLLALATESAGVWVQTRDGAWRLVDGSEDLGSIYAILSDGAGKYWAGTVGGLYHFNGQLWEQYPLLEDAYPPVVFAILRDIQGGLWVGTADGCFYDYDAEPDTPALQLSAQDGLANDRIRTMAFDSDGALWLGTIGGASRYGGSIWQRVSEPAVQDKPINALLTDRSGRTWAGTEGDGLAMWDGKHWSRWNPDNGFQDDRVVSLFEDSRGWIWAGTGQGAGYRDSAGEWHFITPADGLASVPVWAISQDKYGSIFLGTEDGGNFWSPDAGLRQVPELAGRRINAAYYDGDGILWTGTDAGELLQFADDLWSIFGSEGRPRIASVVVNGIIEDATGKIWVGSYDDGVWHYLDGRWQPAGLTLPSPRVLALGWSGNSMWVGTRGGVARFDGQTAAAYGGGVLPRPEVFALADGGDGSLWVGTAFGLVHYKPERTRPWVKVKAVNLIPPLDGMVTLKANDALGILLEGGDTGTLQSGLVYLAQLQGVDAAPRVSKSAFVSYDSLALQPGRYSLRLWARDAAFNYSPPISIRLTVPVPAPVITLAGRWSVPARFFYVGLLLGVMAVGSVSVAGGLAWRYQIRDRKRTAALAARRREAIARRFNPYISGEPVREPSMFYGREELLRKILDALHRNSIMIHGERRIGKTTLLHQLSQELEQLADPVWMFIPVLVDMEGTPESRFFHLLMESLVTVLRSRLPQMPHLRFKPDAERTPEEGPQPYTDRDFTLDLRGLLECLIGEVAPRQPRLILLIDEIDVINSYSTLLQQQVRRIFMSGLARHLGAVVAGIQISKAWDRVESPWYNLFNEICLEPFSPDEARGLLVEPVRGVYEWDPAAVAYVLERSGGRPYRIQQYGLEAVNQILARARHRITLADVIAADAAIEHMRMPERQNAQP